MIGVYARVSTEEQAKKGYSLSDQIRACKAKAGTDEVREYVDEGISGAILERPALNRLREDVNNGLIDHIIVYDLDRLSRNHVHQIILVQEWEKKGVKLDFVNMDFKNTPEGMLFFHIRSVIAQYEKEMIRVRMARGRREKARRGKVLRDFQIYGYDYDPEREQLVINEEEAAVVRLIFDLFTTPNDLVQGINGIARYLNENKYPTKRGAEKWNRQVVRQILMNEVYIGNFYQNRWNTEGMHMNEYLPPDERVKMKQRPREEWILTPCPAIIKPAQFKHAQQLLALSRRRWAGKSMRKYLLSGLVRCGECGNTMTGRRAKYWGKYVLEYTDRKNYEGAKNRGCGMSISCEELDAYVWGKVKEWLDNPDAINEAEESSRPLDMEFERAEMERVQKELEKTRAGREKLLRLVASGMDIDEAEIQKAIRESKEREKELLEYLERLKKELEQGQDAEYKKGMLQEAVRYYLNADGELSFEDKKIIINHVVSEIYVYKDRIEIYGF